MRNIITVCLPILASGSAFADGGPFGNPDLNGAQYPVTMSEPVRNIERELFDIGIACDDNFELYSDMLTYAGREDLAVTVCPLPSTSVTPRRLKDSGPAYTPERAMNPG